MSMISTQVWIKISQKRKRGKLPQKAHLKHFNEGTLGRMAEQCKGRDKLKLTGQNLGRVFNFRNVCMRDMHLYSYAAKGPNLELKTEHKQLFFLPLDIILPVQDHPLRRKGPYSQHFLFFVTYNWTQYSRVFVHDASFQPSLMFVSKVRAYLSEAHFRWSTLGQASGLKNKKQTLDYAVKTCKEQTLWCILTIHIISYEEKSVANKAPDTLFTQKI